MKRFLFIFGALVLVVFNSAASNNLVGPLAETAISGVITDGDTGEPVIAATIKLLKDSKFITATTSDWDGRYTMKNIEPDTYDIEVSYIGYSTETVMAIKVEKGKNNLVNVSLTQGVELEEVVVVGYKKTLVAKEKTTQGVVITADEIRNLPQKNVNALAAQSAGCSSKDTGNGVVIRGSRVAPTDYYIDGIRVQGNLEVVENKEPQNSERYDEIVENKFVKTRKENTSTFSIDVDNAAYSNVRRFIDNGQLPPADAVRIEEMINYFDYEYAQPKGDIPFNVITEVAPCPWNPKNYLVHIGLQGKKIDRSQLPPSNIVFLLDVSGSMNAHNKLPLLKQSLALLTDQLTQNDKVSIVVYAGAAGLVLPATNGSQKTKIKTALNNLRSGGGTAGGQGIKLAYAEARKHFIKGGNNRVILATDGDFNVGVSGDDELVKLIEKERESGVFLTILGFGQGNYQDAKMQKLANKGNGNHAYIDSYDEAKKVLMKEFGGTMYTIAKDVKIQIEFMEEMVKRYRLIGYENRMLKNEDFANDKIDAGELGSGHTVTALYEVTLTNDYDEVGVVQPERGEAYCPISPLGKINLRYKQPDGDTSQLTTTTIAYPQGDVARSSDNFRWAAAIAEYGLVLRDSKYKAAATLAHIQTYASTAKGADKNKYRQKFVDMLHQTTKLKMKTK